MATSVAAGRRVVIACAFGLAVAAPAVVVVAGPLGMPARAVLACPNGEIDDIYTGQCLPEVSPNVPDGTYPTPAASGGTPSAPGTANSLPEVQDVPCTGSTSGLCIGLSENQVPAVTPNSSISSSP